MRGRLKCHDISAQNNNHTVYARGALDALAVSQRFEMETQICSQCCVTHDLIRSQQPGKTITNTDDVGSVYFGIGWAAWC